jgi:carbonic anhydrase
MRMLITCSDARIPAERLVDARPGEVFVLRNAGNIIPHAGTAASGSEAATIDLAVEALGVTEIIVCGHTDCGAMNALVGHPASPAAGLASMRSWLQHARRTKELVESECDGRSPDERLSAAVDANVGVQVENLKSYPAVARRLSSGQLKISPMIYDLETGVVRGCRRLHATHAL